MNKPVTIVLFLALAIGLHAQPIVLPAVWLRADSAVLGASSWHDVSGNGYNATPSSGAMPAAFSRMNFNRCFEVDGETFTLSLGVNDSRQSDVLVVYETYDTIGENALWQIGIDSAKRVGQTTRRILNDNGQIIYDTTNRMKPVINYLAQSWREPEVCAPSFTLCAADSLTLSGRIAEAMYFDRRLSDTAVIQWLSYLAIKYGVTLSGTDYLDSRRNVVWDCTRHPEYGWSVAGIGRDDSVGLYQKQTCFADGQIVFGVSQLALTNEENPSVISDGDFILMGMDSSRLDATTEIYTQSGETYEVVGKCLVQVTNNISDYQTFILLDTSSVSDTVVPVLLIDRSGTGDFPAGETEMAWSSGLDNLGHHVYENLHWDTDRNGVDFFCFAITIPDSAQTKALASAGFVNGTAHDDMARNVSGKGEPAVQAEPDNQKDLMIAATSVPQYRLSPNPNNGRFAVHVQYPEQQEVVVTVYDADGRSVLSVSGRGRQEYRFVGEVPTSGQYLIDIQAQMERKTIKMVVN